MSTVADLMEDALETSIERILEDILSCEAIAEEAYFFVRRAAKKRRHEYTESEKQDVIEKFLSAMRFYSQVTGMQGITSLDLTQQVHL